MNMTTIESELAKFRACIAVCEFGEGCDLDCKHCEHGMPIRRFTKLRELMIDIER